jgi:hypothetical protein
MRRARSGRLGFQWSSPACGSGADTAGVLLASGWWRRLDEVWAEVMKVMERSPASIASWRIEEAWQSKYGRWQASSAVKAINLL